MNLSNDKPLMVPHQNSKKPLYEFVVSTYEIENKLKNADYKSWSIK